MITARIVHIGVALLTAAFPTRAQFAALPDSNATWTETFWIGPGYPYEGYFYQYDQVSPDTMHNGAVFKKLLTRYAYAGTTYGPAYGGALRDNGEGQVYFWEPGTADPVLLYDLDVATGDTILDVFGLYTTDVRVYAVDTVVVHGTQRRRVSVECLDGPGSYGEEWIQGIGSVHGLLHSAPCGSVSGLGQLVCMTVNDTVHWGANVGGVGDCAVLLGMEEGGTQDDLLVFPVPAEDRLEVVCPTCHQARVTVQAMDGRVYLQRSLSAGVLYLDGLSAGAYMLRITDAAGAVRTARFVKR